MKGLRSLRGLAIVLTDLRAETYLCFISNQQSPCRPLRHCHSCTRYISNSRLLLYFQFSVHQFLFWSQCFHSDPSFMLRIRWRVRVSTTSFYDFDIYTGAIENFMSTAACDTASITSSTVYMQASLAVLVSSISIYNHLHGPKTQPLHAPWAVWFHLRWWRSPSSYPRFFVPHWALHLVHDVPHHVFRKRNITQNNDGKLEISFPCQYFCEVHIVFHRTTKEIDELNFLILWIPRGEHDLQENFFFSSDVSIGIFLYMTPNIFSTSRNIYSSSSFFFSSPLVWPSFRKSRSM